MITRLDAVSLFGVSCHVWRAWGSIAGFTNVCSVSCLSLFGAVESAGSERLLVEFLNQAARAKLRTEAGVGALLSDVIVDMSSEAMQQCESACEAHTDAAYEACVHVGSMQLRVSALGEQRALGVVEDARSRSRSGSSSTHINFLDTLIEQLPAMIFIKDAKELRFERFNVAGEALLGLARSELIGKNDYDFFPKEQADFFVSKDREVLSGKTVKEIPEEPIQTHRGTRWLHTRKIPLFDEHGMPEHLLGVSIDITERKQAEDRLRLQFELLSRVSDAVITCDAEFRIMGWNQGAEKMYGWLAHEVVGKVVTDLVKTQYGAVSRDEVLQETLTHGHWSGEVIQERKDGAQITVLASASVIKDAAGNPSGYASVNRDVSERKAAERALEHSTRALENRSIQLQETNRDLESFTYSVSHDLRAPLRAINGFSAILLESYGNKLDDEGRRVISVIRRNAERMGQLIDDLLAFSRLGRQAIHAQQVDMQRLVDATWQEVRARQSRGSVVLELGALPSAYCDAALVRQVWVNLLENAFKYTRPRIEAVVRIRGRVDANRSIYSVSDNGVGFDMQYADKLFGVFQRLHPESQFEGTGVGLALVQRIVQRHNGEVWADAKVNEGATFTFSLPNAP